MGDIFHYIPPVAASTREQRPSAKIIQDTLAARRVAAFSHRAPNAEAAYFLLDLMVEVYG